MLGQRFDISSGFTQVILLFLPTQVETIIDVASSFGRLQHARGHLGSFKVQGLTGPEVPYCICDLGEQHLKGSFGQGGISTPCLNAIPWITAWGPIDWEAGSQGGTLGPQLPRSFPDALHQLHLGWREVAMHT